METRKLILGTIFLFISLMALGQNKFDLTPDNMIKFIGKVNQEQFEQSVGSPVGEEEGFIVYEVENTYDNEITAIRCFYRESDEILPRLLDRFYSIKRLPKDRERGSTPWDVRP